MEHCSSSIKIHHFSTVFPPITVCLIFCSGFVDFIGVSQDGLCSIICIAWRDCILLLRMALISGKPLLLLSLVFFLTYPITDNTLLFDHDCPERNCPNKRNNIIRAITARPSCLGPVMDWLAPTGGKFQSELLTTCFLLPFTHPSFFL